MNTLAIYDIDDTIIMVDISIGVKNDQGDVVEWITAGEYYERADRGEIEADKCCFSQYNCATTFRDTGSFNPVVTEQLLAHLKDPKADVWLVTGRNTPDCLDTYMEKFHNNGVDLDKEQIIFAADGTEGDARTHTSIMKRPHYQRLVTQKYNRVVAFEDSALNLKTLHEVCVDLDVPFEGHLVLENGTTKRFTLADVPS